MTVANVALAYVRMAETFKRTGEQSIKVPGAKGAYRINYTYRAGKGIEGGQGLSDQVTQGSDIAVVDGEGEALLVRITRHKGKLDRGTMKHIVGSIKMTPS